MSSNTRPTPPRWLNTEMIPQHVKDTTDAHIVAITTLITEHLPTIVAAREHVLSLAQIHQGTPDAVWAVIAAETGETALWDLLDAFGKAVLPETTAAEYDDAVQRLAASGPLEP